MSKVSEMYESQRSNVQWHVQQDQNIAEIVEQLQQMEIRKPIETDPTSLYTLFQQKRLVQSQQHLYYLQHKDDTVYIHRLNLINPKEAPFVMEVKFNQTTMSCSEILNNNPLFELEIEDQRVMIKIKQWHTKQVLLQSNLKSLVIKEVYCGTLSDSAFLEVYSLHGFKQCIQADFHPMNSDYICVLTTSKQWNKANSLEKDQLFIVYRFNTCNTYKEFVKINLDRSNNMTSLIGFTYATMKDACETYIYFTNISGDIYYFNLILQNLLVSFSTYYHIINHEPIVAEYLRNKEIKLINEKILLTYDCTQDYTNQTISKQQISIAQQDKNKSNCTLTIKSPCFNNLFIQLFNPRQGQLYIQAILSQDLRVGHVIFETEISLDLQAHSGFLSEDEIIVTKCLKNNIPHQVKHCYPYDCQSNIQNDISNRMIEIVYFCNQLILIDYSNLYQQKWNDAILVSCIEIGNQVTSQSEQIQLIQQQYAIQQVVALDISCCQHLIIHSIKEFKGTYQIVDFNSISSMNSTQADDFKGQQINQEQLQYQQNKQLLSELRRKLEKQQFQCTQATKDDDIVKINQNLIHECQELLHPVAESIQMDHKQIRNDLSFYFQNQEIKSLFDKVCDLEQKVNADNDKIYQLLRRVDTSSTTQLEPIKQIQELEEQLRRIEQHYQEQKLQLDRQICKQGISTVDLTEIQMRLLDKLNALKLNIMKK